MRKYAQHAHLKCAKLQLPRASHHKDTGKKYSFPFHLNSKSCRIEPNAVLLTVLFEGEDVIFPKLERHFFRDWCWAICQRRIVFPSPRSVPSLIYIVDTFLPPSFPRVRHGKYFLTETIFCSREHTFKDPDRCWNKTDSSLMNISKKSSPFACQGKRKIYERWNKIESESSNN